LLLFEYDLFVESLIYLLESGLRWGLDEQGRSSILLRVELSSPSGIALRVDFPSVLIERCRSGPLGDEIVVDLHRGAHFLPEKV
jgi:hypothetical protein